MNFVTIWIGDIKTDYVIHPNGTILSLWKGNHPIYNYTPFTREKKCSISNGGYKCIGLIVDGEKKKFTLHRLLGLHFIPNPYNKPTVDHIDQDKLNNDLSNLRWYTCTEQIANRSCSGGRKITKGSYRKHGNRYEYRWCEYTKRKYKTFKTEAEVKEFQILHLKSIISLSKGSK